MLSFGRFCCKISIYSIAFGDSCSTNVVIKFSFYVHRFSFQILLFLLLLCDWLSKSNRIEKQKRCVYVCVRKKWFIFYGKHFFRFGALNSVQFNKICLFNQPEMVPWNRCELIIIIHKLMWKSGKYHWKIARWFEIIAIG